MNSRLMKKLLIILLFFTCTAKAQIVVNGNTFTSSSDATSYIVPLPLVAGRLYVVIIESSHASTTPNIPSLTINANTNTQFATATCNTIATPLNRITAFRFVASATASESTTIGFTGQTQTGLYGILYEMSGAITTGTNGADGIVQSVTSNADATANPTITMAAITNGQNSVLAAFVNDVPATFGGAAEASWVQDFNAGHDAAGYFGMHRLATTDNTPTVTASSSNWAGIAIEILSATPAGRRRIIID